MNLVQTVPLGSVLFLVPVAFATGYVCAWISGKAEGRRRP